MSDCFLYLHMLNVAQLHSLSFLDKCAMIIEGHQLSKYTFVVNSCTLLSNLIHLTVYNTQHVYNRTFFYKADQCSQHVELDMSLLQKRDSTVGQERVGGNVYLDGYASLGSHIKATWKPGLY